MAYEFVAVAFNGKKDEAMPQLKVWEILLDIRPWGQKGNDTEALVINHVDFEKIIRYSYVN